MDPLRFPPAAAPAVGTGLLIFAMGEAMAHLHCLYYRGALVRYSAADGFIRYVRDGVSPQGVDT